MRVNLLGFAHLYDNRDVHFPGCFDARECLLCGLWNLRQPYCDASLHTAHNWDDPAMRPYSGEWAPLELLSECKDCGVVWRYTRTHSKQKLP